MNSTVSKLKVLVATATAGAGHLQAAAALQEAWLEIRPQDEVRNVDILDFTPKLYKKIYAEGYLKIIEHAPELYAYAFEKSDNLALMRKLNPLRKTFSKLAAHKFLGFISGFQPAVLLCPHFLPIEVATDLRRKRKGYLPYIVCVITDFHAHVFWMDPAVDLYCVAAEKTKKELVHRGVCPEKICVTGIPVGARFRMPVRLREIRKKYNLDSRITTLLVLSGGFGVGPIAEILNELNRIQQPLQILVVAGRNQQLKMKLESQIRKFPTRVFGFVQNMHELMAISDLIITKPGGLTSSEALAMGKPLFLIHPVPGQESANCDFLVKQGVAVRVKKIEKVAGLVNGLLGSKKLAEMASASRSLGKPRAAIQICREILVRIPD